MKQAYYRKFGDKATSAYLIVFDDENQILSITHVHMFERNHDEVTNQDAPEFETGMFIGPICPETGNTYTFERKGNDKPYDWPYVWPKYTVVSYNSSTREYYGFDRDKAQEVFDSIVQRIKDDTYNNYTISFYCNDRLVDKYDISDGDDQLGTDWCNDNDCEQKSCHRCFPRKGCYNHEKCVEFTLEHK